MALPRELLRAFHSATFKHRIGPSPSIGKVEPTGRALIGVGMAYGTPPLPPNRTGGFPARIRLSSQWFLSETDYRHRNRIPSPITSSLKPWHLLPFTFLSAHGRTPVNRISFLEI